MIPNWKYSLSELNALCTSMEMRAEIRRKIPRPEPDRIANDLEKAAQVIRYFMGLAQ